jgi:sodium-dependent dicarboxylate transporter 2/3/5
MSQNIIAGENNIIISGLMLKKRNYLLIVIGLLVFLALYTTDIGIPLQARIVLAVVLLAGILWFTEALPLHVTGIIIAFSLATVGGFSAKSVFNPFFDPIIALLLGGFVLAVGMQKHGLDVFMARRFLNRAGNKPKNVLIGMMLITSFLSFWITNTASTLIMLPIAISILKSNGLKPFKSKYAKALVLGVAFSATLGGLGTIIGSTPNAISVKFLADNGIPLTFLDWMMLGVPLVIIMLPVIWFVLLKVFPSEIDHLHIEKFTKTISPNQKKVFIVFLITVALWLTTNFHGISSSVIALVPIILLYLLGLLNTKDFSRINWSALILFGSGLSLGSAIHNSGLDAIMASSFGGLVFGQPLFIIMLAIIGLGIALTAFASNTAAASIFVPVILPFAAAMGVDLKLLTIMAAMSVSLDFIVPIGTPPDTIAYASGYIRIKDMAKAGILITIAAMLVLGGLFYLIMGG